MAKRIASYETLLEHAADNLDAWRKLQAVHAIKARGGRPEIYWNRRDGFSVIDLTIDHQPKRAHRMAG
jgi:hypothetical protein